MNRAVITQFNNTIFLLIYEENELAECHPIQEKQTLQIGNIYIGRVEKVVKNIQSAFIRLEEDHVGYLPLNDKPAVVLNRQLPKGLPSIAENDLILVQVEQEPQKMKQARVTGNICLSGNYVALDLAEGNLGVSKKIKDAARIKELKDLIAGQQNPSYGCVLRTACENAPDEAVLSEYSRFCREMEQILQKGQFERKTGCIKQGMPEYIALLSEYGIERLDEIKTDIEEVFDELKNAGVNAIFYEEKEYPLYKLLSLETELKRLLNKKVWLKSGGFLVIEPTEAMVVIDVNSGKSIGKKNMEKHILQINLEAAREILRQIRLRNLSGIIMVDFINMHNVEAKEQLQRVVEQGLKKDKVPGYLVEVTKLDLFELTRKKLRKPIFEILNFDGSSYN